MSIKYGFFDAEGGEGNWDRTYTAEDFTDYLGTMISSGVQRGYENEFSFQSISTDTPHYFVVNSGKAWIKGRYIVNSGSYGVYYNQETYEPTVASTYWLCLCAYCNTKDRECDIKFVYLGDEYYRPVDTSTEFYVPLYAVRVNYDGNSYSVLEYNDVREYASVTGDANLIGGTTDYGTIDVTDNIISLTNGYAKLGAKDAVALGDDTTAASRTESVAIGIGAETDGTNGKKVVIGYKAKASGHGAEIAIGAEAETSGAESIAIGLQAQSSSSGIALGYEASATGEKAIAIGNGISATEEGQIVIGYNAITSSNYKFIIGDGDGMTAHNLLTIDNDGIMEINGSAVNTLAIPKTDYDALVARVESLESKLGG